MTAIYRHLIRPMMSVSPWVYCMPQCNVSRAKFSGYITIFPGFFSVFSRTKVTFQENSKLHDLVRTSVYAGIIHHWNYEMANKGKWNHWSQHKHPQSHKTSSWLPYWIFYKPGAPPARTNRNDRADNKDVVKSRKLKQWHVSYLRMSMFGFPSPEKYGWQRSVRTTSFSTVHWTAFQNAAFSSSGIVSLLAHHNSCSTDHLGNIKKFWTQKQMWGNTAENKAIIDSTLCPWCATHEYFWSSLLSKIWLKYWLLSLWYYMAA